MIRLSLRDRLVLAAIAVALVAEVLLLHPKGLFLLAAGPTTIIGLGAMYLRSGDRRCAIYATGIVAALAGYCYLALTQAGFFEANDEVAFWGDFNKRPLVFAYLILGAFGVFHWVLVGMDRRGGPRPLRPPVSSRASWLARLPGAVVIAALAWWWIGLPALHPVQPLNDISAVPFYNIHVRVHLGAFEQIRLGAMPYVEADTQYGFGNQLLLYALTRWESFSFHGFHIINVWLNAGVVVLFFVVLQMALGFGWAFAALVGWLIWPSPADIMTFSGWGILTRWAVVPMLAVLLAPLLANAASSRRLGLKACLLGLLWGAGGYLSQENMTGGVMVLVFALAIFGPVSGVSLGALVRMTLIFLVSGGFVFVAGVSAVVGPLQLPHVLHIASAKSSLVTAGITNAIWAPLLDSNATLSVLCDKLPIIFRQDAGEAVHFLQTYGAVLLLPFLLTLMARLVNSQWQSMEEEPRRLAVAFGGVVIGAFVLHLFAMFRSDWIHLAAPSFLLPLLILMLPVFAWRCLDRGVLRTGLLVVSALAIVVAPLCDSASVRRKIAAIGNPQTETILAWENAREVHRRSAQVPDLVGRYSPLPEHAATFRRQPDFVETEELFQLLHERLGPRPVELASYELNSLIWSPELFYFLGGFRSVSGITSPMNSLWLRSEETAWIHKVANANHACIFFVADGHDPFVGAWKRALGSLPAGEAITGRKPYGTLACRD